MGIQKFSIFTKRICSLNKMAGQLVGSRQYISNHCKVAVMQLNSTNNKEDNFLDIKDLTEKAVDNGAKLLFFPEGCDYIAENKVQSLEMAEGLNGPTMQKYMHLAKTHNVWLSLGGIHIKEENDSKIHNTHVLINDGGSIVGKYSKTHLFDVKMKQKNVSLQESKYVVRGTDIPPPLETPCGQVALGICYDLRFPEFSLIQRRLGAEITTFPSAFTVPTGEAHWHALLRARAIETQCYVIAAAQTGVHNSKRSSYGHAMIIDPWGKIVAEIGEGVDFAIAEIDLGLVRRIREEMPVFSHRRSDLYCLRSVSGHNQLSRIVELCSFPPDFVLYPFGHVTLPGSTIFLLTGLSLCVVNKKPVVPGHTLVMPQRPLYRLGQLSTLQVCDLAQTIVLALKILRLKYATSRVQFAVQDGPHAGQTVQHVHAHLLPIVEQSPGLMERHEATESKWREVPEMEEEAADLRTYTLQMSSDQWLSSPTTPRPMQLRMPKDGEKYWINDFWLESRDIVFATDFSLAFLPSNPILPGHICVSVSPNVSSLSELEIRELCDLFLAIQRVQAAIEEETKAASSTIYTTDGSLDKLCIHIIPRMENDLEDNDDIYNLLKSHSNQPENKDTNLLQKLRQNFFSSPNITNGIK